MNQLSTLLGQTQDRILQGDGHAATSALIDALRDHSRNNTLKDWLLKVIPACKSHPVHELLLQDPFTWRAYKKPRGYGGDPVMLDYLYSGTPPASTTAIGSEIFKATTGFSNAQSVVFRKNLLAARIDETAKAFPNAKILSITCGHLREAQEANLVKNGQIGEFIALDQDQDSLSVVAREQGSSIVKTVRASVKSMILGQTCFQNLHFVYAAGLFDCLPNEMGNLLLTLMFKMISPGGKVLIANFLPDNHGRGYMECMMDWKLICRRESDTLALTAGIDASQMESESIWRDPYGNVVYLELVKS
jgi:hypothetical protein